MAARLLDSLAISVVRVPSSADGARSDGVVRRKRADGLVQVRRGDLASSHGTGTTMAINSSRIGSHERAPSSPHYVSDAPVTNGGSGKDEEEVDLQNHNPTTKPATNERSG